MKFSEFPYQRPDYEQLMSRISELTRQFQSAQTAGEQLAILKQLEQLRIELRTSVQIATIRYTVDTRDAFYSAEEEYNEQMAPVVDEKLQEFNKALVASPFRKELEAEYGSLLFRNIELALKAFSPALIPLIQQENLLVQQYQKLCASAKIEFDGKVCNLSQLGPYQQSPDRAVRKAAAQAYGKFFDDHQQELDELFDKLVKNRTEQAHTLGLSNYVEMAYLLQTRNCYGPKEVANFRRQVVEEIVPVNNEIKAHQAKRIGVEGMQVYDNTYFFAGRQSAAARYPGRADAGRQADVHRDVARDRRVYPGDVRPRPVRRPLQGGQGDGRLLHQPAALPCPLHLLPTGTAPQATSTC